MQLAFDIADPEIEEAAQHGKMGGDIEMLPEEGLQHVRVIREMVEDLRGGEAVAPELET
jgi:hypothetical protein